MPIRDHSLQLNTAFFKEMKNILESFNKPNANQSQNQNQHSTTFCHYLLKKYNECASQSQSPEITCQPEMEIIFLTHCATILKYENSNRLN